MFFSSPVCLVLLLGLIPIYLFGYLRRSTVAHTKTTLHRNLKTTSVVSRLPPICLFFAWTFLSLALSRPVLVEAKNNVTIESRDIIISLDVSSSMDGAVPEPSDAQDFCQEPLELVLPAANESADAQPTVATATAPTGRYTRLDAARQAALMFVACRNGDRVAYLPFADRSYTGWPLTTDLQIVYTMIALAGDYSGGGTNFDGPNSTSGKIGALQAAINHFEESGHAETRVLVLVSDGEDSITAQRFAELSEQMRRLNIRIYVLGVGSTWANSSTQALRAFVEEVGGLVIPVTDADQMRAAFQRIDELEKSDVVVEVSVTYREIYHWFLLGMTVFGTLYLLSSALVREDI